MRPSSVSFDDEVHSTLRGELGRHRHLVEPICQVKSTGIEKSRREVELGLVDIHIKLGLVDIHIQNVRATDSDYQE